jgi:hypothetical protein
MKSTLHVPRIRWRRPPSAPVRVTALITGAATADASQECIDSLAAEWAREGRKTEDLEVLVVADDAGAIGRALGQSSGAARDIVAVVRHDVVFQEGALKPLLERLQGDPDCGAVAPRVYVDAARQLQPAIRAWPSAITRLWRAAAGRWALFGRWYAARRHREAVQWWTTENALASSALPSPCVFQRRKAIERAAGLRDPRFEGDFAALDYARRIQRSGYKLVFEPRARIVVRGPVVAGKCSARARAAFEASHFGAFERALQRVAAALEVRGCPRADARASELGLVEDSPTFRFGRPLRYVVELSNSPRWLDAAGAIGEGDAFRFEEPAWNCIGPGPHFLRAIDRDSGRTIGAWRFRKPRSKVVRQAGVEAA